MAGEARVRAAVLRRLLRGEPVDPASLGASVGLPAGAVAEALAGLQASGAVYLAEGIVRAAYPLSGVPTPHLVRHDGTTLYACCAIDALAVPAMVDAAVTVESRCADCDNVIRVEMTGERILASQPDAPVVFHVSRDCCEAGPTILTRCPHINFFCGLDHARRWQAANPGRVGDTLSLSQAVAWAHEIFASTVRLLQAEDAGGEGGGPPQPRSR